MRRTGPAGMNAAHRTAGMNAAHRTAGMNAAHRTAGMNAAHRTGANGDDRIYTRSVPRHLWRGKTHPTPVPAINGRQQNSGGGVSAGETPALPGQLGKPRLCNCRLTLLFEQIQHFEGKVSCPKTAVEWFRHGGAAGAQQVKPQERVAVGVHVHVISHKHLV